MPKLHTTRRPKGAPITNGAHPITAKPAPFLHASAQLSASVWPDANDAERGIFCELEVEQADRNGSYLGGGSLVLTWDAGDDRQTGAELRLPGSELDHLIACLVALKARAAAVDRLLPAIEQTP
jgi:hypothetical protein